MECQQLALCQNIELRRGDRLKVTGVDFAGPFLYKVSKQEQGKCYVIIFTCASSRAVHLEVARTQTADEFKSKLNAFISRRTRPCIIISDNAKTFKATADCIKTVRRSEKLQNYLARENIRWQFNFAKSPWWGGIYERLIKEIKKTLHKTLGSLMESHRLNKVMGTIPHVGEIVLIIGDAKNRGEWRKGKVVRLIKGKDDVVREVTLLHKGHTIDRPLQLVCPLEIRAVEDVDKSQRGRRDGADVGEWRPGRAAAQRATQRIAEQLQEEEN
ncbi:hypothetical protein AWC38_SpisGene19335 [Stylophora pistillata]|uniref:Integrase catalytic domain-containing protein n=1 Tax=Stylophora pistillata TaxID=50429 RepID=A0A2B4RIU7_STYPI|nr:hypothetical protein AWC38_SpisGene19335 [Stylophora pistillata]